LIDCRILSDSPRIARIYIGSNVSVYPTGSEFDPGSDRIEKILPDPDRDRQPGPADQDPESDPDPDLYHFQPNV
jgi:hypothetical protein